VPDPDIGRGFQNVDRAGAAPGFIAYLDRARGLHSDLKRQTIAALQLQVGDAVLDVGCGTGDDLQSLADGVTAAGRVVGIDVSEELIGEARKRTHDTPHIEVLKADAQALPFSAAEFSASRADRVLMHVDKPDVVLTEMVRVTRREGRLVLSEPDWDTLVIESDDLVIARRVARTLADSIRHPDIGRRLVALAADAGLHVHQTTCAAIAIRDLAMADALFRLQWTVDSLGDAGVQAWWNRLQERSTRAPFFAAVTGVTVVATTS
jgi:SAM-dependent methyltransferase